MTDEEIRARFDKLSNIDLGKKGYLRVWREPGAIGLCVFPCREVITGIFGSMTLSSWTVIRAVALVESEDEEAAIDSLLLWFDRNDLVKAPSISVRGRFSGWTVELISAHHRRLLEEKKSWNNNRLASEFVFKFMDEYQRERWSKRIFEGYEEGDGVHGVFEGEMLVVSYRWNGSNVQVEK